MRRESATAEASAPASEGRDLGNAIVVRLLASHNLLLGALRTGLGPTISLARFDLVAQLDREDGQTLAALSRKMLVTAGNLTGLVDRAERDGIVERRPDPSDRRLTRVHLTPKGERLAALSIRRHGELASRLVAPLEAQEQADLRRLLGRLRESLEAFEASTKATPSRSARSPRKNGQEHGR
jgi:DNA-binding MarR family transcriptional regulator